MSHQLLDGADVVAVLQEVGRERVTKGVAGAVFLDSGFMHCALDGALKVGVVEPVAAELARLAVDDRLWIRERPLPGEAEGSIRVLAREGVGQIGAAATAREVALVPCADAAEVGAQWCNEGVGECRDPILSALSGSDDDLPAIEVEVLDAKLEAFGEAKAGPIEEASHEPGNTLETSEYGGDLVAREDCGESGTPLSPEDAADVAEGSFKNVAIEKNEGAKGGVLSIGGNLAVGGEPGEEISDVALVELEGVAHSAPGDELLDIGLVGSFAPWAEPAKSGGGVEAVKEARFGHGRTSGARTWREQAPLSVRRRGV